MKWMEGYANDSTYTRGYYRELDPRWVKFAVLDAGYQAPETTTAWELGFGQGITLAFNAITQDVTWYGNDFNSSHCNNANTLLQASGITAQLSAEPFSELALRTDLPKLDFISLHGIWSWVNHENQENILRFIDRNLSNNGMVYISYNTSPGTTVFSPVRELFRHEFANNTNRGLPIAERVQASLKRVSDLMSVDSKYFLGAESAKMKLDTLKTQDSAYLAHEYLNLDWNIESFLSISNKLKEIKLDFVTSAEYLDGINDINLTADQKKILNGISDKYESEHIKDIYWNQSFRKDIWVRGAAEITAQEKWEQLSKFKVGISSAEPIANIKLHGRAFEGTVDEPLYKRITEEIRSHGVISIGELSNRISDQPHTTIVESVKILLALNRLYFAGEHKESERQKAIRDVNMFIASKAVKKSTAHSYLCSPLSGSAVACDRLLQLCMYARSRKARKIDSICQFIYEELSNNGEFLSSDGRLLQSLTEATPFIKEKLENLSEQNTKQFTLHGLTDFLL